MEFLKQIQKITYVYDIPDEQAVCYLSNYEDGYICHKHNGGCKNINICRKISENERKTKILTNVKRFRMRGRKHVSKYSYL